MRADPPKKSAIRYSMMRQITVEMLGDKWQALQFGRKAFFDVQFTSWADPSQPHSFIHDKAIPQKTKIFKFS